MKRCKRRAILHHVMVFAMYTIAYMQNEKLSMVTEDIQRINAGGVLPIHCIVRNLFTTNK